MPEPIRTVLIALAEPLTRSELRLLCACIHDVDAVSAVEIDTDRRSLRVTGSMSVDELRAAVGQRGRTLV